MASAPIVKQHTICGVYGHTIVLAVRHQYLGAIGRNINVVWAIELVLVGATFAPAHYPAAICLQTMHSGVAIPVCVRMDDTSKVGKLVGTIADNIRER